MFLYYMFIEMFLFIVDKHGFAQLHYEMQMLLSEIKDSDRVSRLQFVEMVCDNTRGLKGCMAVLLRKGTVGVGLC